jgi:hypothetical protein
MAGEPASGYDLSHRNSPSHPLGDELTITAVRSSGSCDGRTSAVNLKFLSVLRSSHEVPQARANFGIGTLVG